MRAVIVGGGIAGVALSKVLAGRGVQVMLLEKSGQLTSGATWHAAGLVTRFGGGSKLKKLHVRAIELLDRLHDEEEDGIGLHLSGTIRLIEKGDNDRLLEAKQHVGMARLYDDPAYPTEMICPGRISELHPLIDVSNIQAGVYTPHDGDIDPTSLTNCLAKRARQNGAELLMNQEVNAIETQPDGTIRVSTTGGLTLESDIVVNAAGLWSKKVSALAGLTDFKDHPCFVIEHQYAITESIPEVAALSADGQRLPVLRDLMGSNYIRQERDGLLVGPYEAECEVAELSLGWDAAPPASWGMELFPDRLDRIMDNLEVIPLHNHLQIPSQSAERIQRPKLL